MNYILELSLTFYKLHKYLSLLVNNKNIKVLEYMAETFSPQKIRSIADTLTKVHRSAS